MTRIILYELLRVVILNLLYTSVDSDGGRLYPESNPLVGMPFKLVCYTEANITNTVTITFPNGATAGFCDPPSSLVPLECTGSTAYTSALSETETTVTISTNSLASDVNGIWRCTYLADTFSYNLVAPIREIKDENFTLFPPSFTDNITSQTASISLSATYGCINLPVYFKWFVVDNASKKIDINGTNNAAKNSSVCTSGFNGYTETKEVNEDVYSSSSVTNLDGSYRIGVEVHYTDEVTTLHSIKYFDTYFVFSSGGTNTSTDNCDYKAIGILTGCLVIAFIIVIVMYEACRCCGCTCKTCGDCCSEFCEDCCSQFCEDCCSQFCENCCSKFFAEQSFTSSGRESSQTEQSFTSPGRESSQEGEGGPGFFKEKVLTLKSLCIFGCLVFYGVIVEVIVLPAVYYGYSKFQEELVIGVGFGIVLLLSGICLVVVWMLMKFVNNEKSKCEGKPENSTIMMKEKVTT